MSPAPLLRANEVRLGLVWCVRPNVGGGAGVIVDVAAGVVVDAAHEAPGALPRLLQAPPADEEAAVVARERGQPGDDAGAGRAEGGRVLEVRVERVHVGRSQGALQLRYFGREVGNPNGRLKRVQK